MKIDFSSWKVVLWGHKSHLNTFYYVHNAYYKAFKHLNYNVFWFDDDDDVSNFNFKNTLFYTEGQVDLNIPIREDCYYILHNCDKDKYKTLREKNKAFSMQVYTDNVLKYNLTKIDDCIYADYNGKCIYFPWATDLLPNEIEANKPETFFYKESNVVNWVGTMGGEYFGNIEQIKPFIKACEENNIKFNQTMLVSPEENIKLIKASYMAPTIVGRWQHEVGYIPCRIFKNISYGQLGLTSSSRANEFFQGKVYHNNDTYQLFYQGREFLKKSSLSDLYNLMDLVKEKHTYLNRINTVLDFIEVIGE